MFTDNIMPLKINVKVVKIVNRQIYSCGFPATIIEDVKKQLIGIGGIIEESDHLLIVAAVNWEKKGDYHKWCRKQEHKASPAEKGGGVALTNIEKRIVAFQVMRKTPMEAMSFVVELQEKLNGKLDVYYFFATNFFPICLQPLPGLEKIFLCHGCLFASNFNVRIQNSKECGFTRIQNLEARRVSCLWHIELSKKKPQSE